MVDVPVTIACKYRVSENRREIEALRQSLDEQGQVNRKVGVKELFHPSTCDIAKI
jgi:hypothetical protein